MSIGFSVTNDNGSVQVIDTAPLFTLKETFTVITGNSDYGFIGHDYIYAYKPSDGSQLLSNSWRYRYDNGVIRNRIVGKGEIVRFNEGAAPLGGDQFGLEVYNDIGELQYSSNQKPLKVLDFLDISDIRTAVKVVNGRRTYWSKDYGNLEVAALFINKPVWNENPNYMTAAAAKRGSVFAFEAAVEQQDQDAFNNGAYIQSFYTLRVLVIDVTGY